MAGTTRKTPRPAAAPAPRPDPDQPDPDPAPPATDQPNPDPEVGPDHVAAYRDAIAALTGPQTDDQRVTAGLRAAFNYRTR